MADYYTSFSFLIATRDDEERKWLIKLWESIGAAWRHAIDGEDYELSDEAKDVLSELGCELEDISLPAGSLIDEGLWLHTEDAGQPEIAAGMALAYIRKFQPALSLSFGWADTCSKPRLDAFGGGAAFITRDGIEWTSTYKWIADQKKELVS